MNTATRLAANLCVLLGMALAEAGAFEVTLTVEVPPGVAPTAENVKLAPLPAGKKLAVVLYADWGFRSARNAVPLARAFQLAGWRGTFFLAGARDVAQYAPKLEALGQEVATNLFSGGISAYRDEMFSYTPQDIYNAIGPLRSELNAVLKRPVITQLVRGHGVPYRDRIRAMGYLEATHWYTHYVLLGGAPREVPLGGYRKGSIPIVRTGKLDESAFQQAEQNKARVVILGRAGKSLSADQKSFLSKHGGKKDYWYTTLGEFASTIYLQRKAKVSRVKVKDGRAEVTLTLAEDFNPLFLRAPISLDMAGTVVDVPPEMLLGGPVTARMMLSPSRISLPGTAELKVVLSNRGKREVKVGDVYSRGPAGFDVTTDLSAGIRPLAAGSETEVQFMIGSNDKAGPLSFGFTPLVFRMDYEIGGEKRTLLAAAELEVRPALSVDVYPCDGVPLAPKGSQTFMFTVDNIRAGKGRGNWRNLLPKFEKFILPQVGPVIGTITFPESDAFNVEPDEIDLELAVGGERKVFHVTVTNTGPSKAPYVLSPEIRLAGQDRPLLLPFGGTSVHYVEKMGSPALDERGLMMYASWDKLDGGSSPGVARARGRKASYQGAMGSGRIGRGLLGQALLYNSVCLLDPFMNFNESEGTMMFWLRHDPSQKRPFPRRRRERLFSVETQHPARNVATGLLGLSLGETHLIARMMTIGPTYHNLRAPFKKTDEWTHVALTWSCPKKFMRIIVDGEVRGELKDDGKTWYAVPARRWPYHYGDFMTPLSNDHNAYTSTMRDEFCIYNRPLSVHEIQEHIKQVNAKRQDRE